MSLPLCLLLSAPVPAQSSSSSSTPSSGDQQSVSSAGPRRGVEASGSAVSLETSESLFQIAAALNTCGYDNGLETSLPVRAAVRYDTGKAVAESPAAARSQQALCGYIQSHTLGGAQNLSAYL